MWVRKEQGFNEGAFILPLIQYFFENGPWTTCT